MRAKDVTHSALVIYNTFRGHYTETILIMLEENNVYIVIVPGNCTDRLQPLDLSVNKAAKSFLGNSSQSDIQIKSANSYAGVSSQPNHRLMTEHYENAGAQWMISLYDYLKSKPDISINGFKEAGITFT